MKLTVIITAGGIGKRMGSDIPKQFLLLQTKPVLMHTIQQFYDYNDDFEIIVSLPVEYIEFWKDLCFKYNFVIEHSIVEGGRERYHSIKNALKEANGDLVFVHDAVRPLVSKETIRKAEDCATQFGSAIPALPLKDSLRKKAMTDSKHVNRAEFWTVQTPQVFLKNTLENAYKLPFSSEITDDASLIERLGENIYLSEGNEENIKLTTPFDMKVAEFLVGKLMD